MCVPVVVNPKNPHANLAPQLALRDDGSYAESSQLPAIKAMALYLLRTPNCAEFAFTVVQATGMIRNPSVHRRHTTET